MKYTSSDLRERAVISSVSHTTDANFEEGETLAEVATVRGLYLPQTGREVMRNEQVTDEPRAVFVIRYRSWVTAQHVITLRGVLFEIHSVIDVQGRRRYQELVLSERITQPEGEGE